MVESDAGVLVTLWFVSCDQLLLLLTLCNMNPDHLIRRFKSADNISVLGVTLQTTFSVHTGSVDSEEYL
jgi:hypothetical protein